MTEKTAMCVWCDREFFRNELNESRFLGGLVCEDCDADEGNKTLGEIHERLKRRSKRAAEGEVSP